LVEQLVKVAVDQLEVVKSRFSTHFIHGAVNFKNAKHLCKEVSAFKFVKSYLLGICPRDFPNPSPNKK